MTDTSTSDTGSEPLRGVVDNYGTLSGPNEPLSEELQPYADKIMGMDPIRDVPPNVVIEGGYRPAKLKIETLPPALQSEVHRKLEAMPRMDAADRAKYEDHYVAEAIRSQLGTTRAGTGLGPDALPYHKEMVEIAGQVNDLVRKRGNLQAEVDDIARLQKATDPVTGELVAEPIYRLTESKRAAYRDSIIDIDRQIRLLVGSEGGFGIEGRQRMQKALAESAKLLHARDMMQADEAEARKRAEHRLREERIERRADAYAKMRLGS